MSSTDITMVRSQKIPIWPSFSYLTIVVAPVCTLAFWTIACHVCVLFHLSFAVLADIGPFALCAGLALGIFISRSGHLDGADDRGTEASPGRVPWRWMLVPAAAVAARIAGISYQAFWIVCLLFLGWVLVSSRVHRPDPAREKLYTVAQRCGKELAVLLAFALVSGGLTFCAHRPDADDATFVGFAADAVAHPDLPVLSHDVLYGDDRLPLILPTYAVDSYELLVGALSRWFSGAPIWWMHAFIPTAIAFFLPFAWAELMCIFVPRRWLSATGLALLLLLLLGESHYSLGNFAFVRLFQGKAVLASAGIPLLFAWAWKFQEDPRWMRWLLLLTCTVACVGLSAIALFIVPISLGIAAFGTWNFKNTLSSALVVAPALYPLCWALRFRQNVQSVSHFFDVSHMNAQGTIAQVFGAHGQYVIWLGLLCAPLLAPPRHRRRFAAFALLYSLIALDPFLVKIIERIATSVSAWRILWCVPVVGFIAASLVWGIDAARENWGRTGALFAALVIFGCVFYLAPYSSLRRSNSVTFSLGALKVPPQEWAAAEAAVADSPPGTSVLAPESVAAWIPTFVHRPPLVSVRAHYDVLMAIHLPPEQATARRDLREMVSGDQFAPQRREELLDSLQKYSVGLIVANRANADHLEADLMKHGYSRTRIVASYVLFARQSQR